MTKKNQLKKLPQVKGGTVKRKQSLKKTYNKTVAFLNKKGFIK